MKVYPTYKFDNLWHLDLSEDTTGLVIAQVGGIADSECIRPLDSDLPGLAAIELGHSLDFGERNKVAVFESMSSFIQAGHQALRILARVRYRRVPRGRLTHLVHRNNHSTERLFASGVHTCELGTEVIKSRTKESISRASTQGGGEPEPEEPSRLG